MQAVEMAERAGFEPAVRVIPVRRFSKPKTHVREEGVLGRLFTTLERFMTILKFCSKCLISTICDKLVS